MTSMAALGRPDAGRDQQQDDRRQDEAVDDEDVEGMRPQVAEHERRIARSPATKAATRPTTSGATLDVHAGLAADELADLEDAAPAVTGVAIRKLKRAADSRSRPAKRPAEIEMPERLMPGIRAIAWATPIPKASGNVTSPTPFVVAPEAVGEPQDRRRRRRA